MMYQAIIETKQDNKQIKETSPAYDNQLQAEMWLHSVIKEAKDLKVKVVDHYLVKRS